MKICPYTGLKKQVDRPLWSAFPVPDNGCSATGSMNRCRAAEGFTDCCKFCRYSKARRYNIWNDAIAAAVCCHVREVRMLVRIFQALQCNLVRLTFTRTDNRLEILKRHRCLIPFQVFRSIPAAVWTGCPALLSAVYAASGNANMQYFREISQKRVLIRSGSILTQPGSYIDAAVFMIQGQVWMFFAIMITYIVFSHHDTAVNRQCLYVKSTWSVFLSGRKRLSASATKSVRIFIWYPP